MGWSQANVMYDTLSTVPEPGSLQEAVCVLVSQRRAEARFCETLLICTAMVGGSTDAPLARYKDALFPYIAKDRADRDSEARKLLNALYASGPIQIFADGPPDNAQNEAPRRRTRRSK